MHVKSDDDGRNNLEAVRKYFSRIETPAPNREDATKVSNRMTRHSDDVSDDDDDDDATARKHDA